MVLCLMSLLIQKQLDHHGCHLKCITKNTSFINKVLISSMISRKKLILPLPLRDHIKRGGHTLYVNLLKLSHFIVELACVNTQLQSSLSIEIQ